MQDNSESNQRDFWSELILDQSILAHEMEAKSLTLFSLSIISAICSIGSLLIEDLYPAMGKISILLAIFSVYFAVLCNTFNNKAGIHLANTYVLQIHKDTHYGR